MKKVLFIDPIYQPGHVNFNNIYLKEISRYTTDLSVVFVENYPFRRDISVDLAHTIPLKFFKRRNPFLTRLYYLLALFNIKRNVKFGNYDIVIFSSFEEISFFLANIKKAYVINHINLQGLRNRVKRFFLGKVYRNNTPIFFENDMSLEVKNIFPSVQPIISPHGLVEFPGINNPEDFQIFIENNHIGKYETILFYPSDNSTDIFFLKECVESKHFLSFLKKINALLIVKSKAIKSSSDHILIIDYYLPATTYNSLFLFSDIIIIAYPKTFNLRVSGVLYESFAYSKKCLLSKIPTFENYHSFFNYYPFFDSLEELIERIESVIVDDSFTDPYNNLSDLNPNLEKIFE